MGWLWSVRKGKKLEMKLAIVWANRAWVAFNWHVHTQLQEWLKEEDQDISSEQIVWCQLDLQALGLNIGVRTGYINLGKPHVIKATKVIVLNEITVRKHCRQRTERTRITAVGTQMFEDQETKEKPGKKT